MAEYDRAQPFVRLQAAGKAISNAAIEVEVRQIHKERKLASLKASALFQPVCLLIQEMQEWSGTPKQFKELLSTSFPGEFKTWYRSPAKFVEELKKITSVLQEEGITVEVPPETVLVTLITKVE